MTREDLNKAGVDADNYRKPNFFKTQEIGDAAWFLGYDGLIVPSARWDCENLVIFMDKVSSPEAAISVISSEEVDWIQWARDNGIDIPDSQ